MHNSAPSFKSPTFTTQSTFQIAFYDETALQHQTNYLKNNLSLYTNMSTNNFSNPFVILYKTHNTFLSNVGPMLELEYDSVRERQRHCKSLQYMIY